MEKEKELPSKSASADTDEIDVSLSNIDKSLDVSISLLNDNKAGMEGLDKESINKIIYEASKGSLYYENEQRKDAILKARIENQLKQVREITHEQLETSLQKANSMIESLEKERDFSRVIVHIDMDAFYASVEVLSKPHLKNVPMAVGSNHMLSTSNYAARRFGVRAGMPGFIGKKLCPNLVILPTNFDEYRRYSSIFGQVLSMYDPNYSKMGLDEAYLDITDYLDERKRKSSPDQEIKIEADLELEVVNEMRQKIFELTNLTSSAGISSNSMLAKVCSDMNKPDGQFRIERSREAILEFIKDLPIRKISGIGKVSEQMLKSLGISKCSQLIEKRALLCHLHSAISFEHFMRVGLGIGYSQVERDSERKSMSVERTFEDTGNLQQLTNICKNLCQNLVEDLVKENLAAKTITLKIKEITFQVKTRAKTLPFFTQELEAIFGAALNLLKAEQKNTGQLKLRLMGVRASTFMSASEIPKSTQKSLVEILKRQDKCTNSANHDDQQPVDHESSSLSSLSSIHKSHSHSSSELPTEITGITNQSIDSPATPDAVATTEDCSQLHGAACPVCNANLPNDSQSINKHLDECLSRQYIKKVLHDEEQIRRDNAPASTTKHNRAEDSKAKPAPRKRKKMPKCHKTPSLNKFFKPS